MNPIQPTPSQAAVVLKKFLAERAVTLPLGACQEAVARLNGHASWNALTAHQSAREVAPAHQAEAAQPSMKPMCHSCDSPLSGDYCSSETCRYFDWPQSVDRDDIKVFSSEELEEMYHVKERQSPTETEAHRTDKSGAVIPKR